MSRGNRSLKDPQAMAMMDAVREYGMKPSGGQRKDGLDRFLLGRRQEFRLRELPARPQCRGRLLWHAANPMTIFEKSKNARWLAFRGQRQPRHLDRQATEEKMKKAQQTVYAARL